MCDPVSLLPQLLGIAARACICQSITLVRDLHARVQGTTAQKKCQRGPRLVVGSARREIQGPGSSPYRYGDAGHKARCQFASLIRVGPAPRARAPAHGFSCTLAGVLYSDLQDWPIEPRRARRWSWNALADEPVCIFGDQAAFMMLRGAYVWGFGLGVCLQLARLVDLGRGITDVAEGTAHVPRPVRGRPIAFGRRRMRWWPPLFCAQSHARRCEN